METRSACVLVEMRRCGVIVPAAHTPHSLRFAQIEWRPYLLNPRGLPEEGELLSDHIMRKVSELISGVFCATALGVYALIQPGASDDDDSNGGGGGGLMQPIS